MPSADVCLSLDDRNMIRTAVAGYESWNAQNHAIGYWGSGIFVVQPGQHRSNIPRELRGASNAENLAIAASAASSLKESVLKTSMYSYKDPAVLNTTFFARL
jgi:hypothetical protein